MRGKGSATGVATWPNAERRLVRVSAESCVRVMKADICSRGTLSEGLYVDGVVPFVRPEKNASAIWQKNRFPATSVNGSVVDAPPQVPEAAGNLVEATERVMAVQIITNTE